VAFWIPPSRQARSKGKYQGNRQSWSCHAPRGPPRFSEMGSLEIPTGAREELRT